MMMSKGAMGAHLTKMEMQLWNQHQIPRTKMRRMTRANSVCLCYFKFYVLLIILKGDLPRNGRHPSMLSSCPLWSSSTLKGAVATPFGVQPKAVGIMSGDSLIREMRNRQVTCGSMQRNAGLLKLLCQPITQRMQMRFN